MTALITRQFIKILITSIITASLGGSAVDHREVKQQSARPVLGWVTACFLRLPRVIGLGVENCLVTN